MKQKTVLCLLSGLLCSGYTIAQNPKWFKKVQKSQISILTFDEKKQVLHSGSGFFIDEKGTALANYQLFKGAYEAKIIDYKGHEYPVRSILGASSLYDIVKFDIETDKKQTPLTLAEDSAHKEEVVYVLPYPTKENKQCQEDTVIQVASFHNKYHYYTLAHPQSELSVNVPVVNQDGKALAMIQEPGNEQQKQSYAVSIRFGADLFTDGMSVTDGDLNAIHIKKALPEDEKAAATFLYLANTNDSTLYAAYINDFINKYPDSHVGYTTGADFYAKNDNLKHCAELLETGIENAKEKDQMYYTRSKVIYNLEMQTDSVRYPGWDLTKSLQDAEEAYHIKPMPLYQMQRGHILYALKEYQKAYDQYMALDSTNMKSPELYLFAAQCQKMLQAPDSVILNLQNQALNFYSKPYPAAAAPILLARANTLLNMEKNRDAVMDLNEYESLMSQNLNANFYYQKAQAELKCSMYEQAVNDIDRAIRIAPQTPLLYAEKAAICYKVALYDEAIQAALRCIQIDAQFIDAYRILGICQVQSGKKEEGIKNLKKAVSMGDQLADKLLKNMQN